MKTKWLAAFSLFFVLGLNVQAESTVTLTGVHNCCQGCDKGITKAVAKVSGASATTDEDKVTITAKDDADAQKAVASLVDAGYFGKGATALPVVDAKVKSAKVDGVHLCCGKCVKAIDEVVKNVPGATSHDATKGADSFKVEGDFSTATLATALNDAGLSGKIK